MEQSIRKETTQGSAVGALLITFFFPFLGLLLSLYYWRKSWAKNVFWMACVFMGAIQIYCPEGKLLGAGADAGRYVLELIDMHNNVHSFREVSHYFYDGKTIDVFAPTLQFLVSRFTDNGHVFFFFVALIFGFFYSRNIWYVLEKLPDRLPRGFWVLILFFLLVCPIWLINGVRMWTAAHIFAYGAMPYLVEGKKNKLIWCFLSIFVHHSFIFPIITIALFFLLSKRLQRKESVLTVLFVFYLLTLGIKTLNLDSLNTILQIYLPNFYEDRINGYVNEDVLEKELEAATQLSWHVTLFNAIEYWTTQLLIVLSFFSIRRNRKDCEWLVPLFAFALLIYGGVNILSSVPSGARYVTIARLFMVPVFIFTMSYVPLGKWAKTLLPLCLFFIAFAMIFEIRKGFDYYGIMLIVGNFISMFFVESNVPLIDFVKQFF